VIFVDTSFWVALINQRASRHADAATLLAAHQTDRLLTTNHVRGETWTFLRRRAGHAAAVRFLDSVGSSRRVEIIHVSEATEAEASAWLRAHDSREYSWVDATSFATMRHRRITEALAFDNDFESAGFVELRV
jgi:predicted nucleic acid-binding protein